MTIGMNSQPAIMTSKDQLIPVGSPYYVVANRASTIFNKAVLKLWVWKGDYRLRTTTEPDYTFTKDKISITDYNIVFEIADYIKPHINPILDGNSVTGEGCWFYYEITYVNNNVPVITTTSKLLFATLGYSYNFEGQSRLNGAIMADGTIDEAFDSDIVSTMKYYSHLESQTYTIANTTNISATNSEQVIVRTNYIPTTRECAKDGYIITFLNKKGLFEQLSTTGKVVIDNDISKESYRRTYRDINNYNSSVNHSTVDFNKKSKTVWKINTGRIDPKLSNKIEEICYSPLVYLKEANTNRTYAVNVSNTSINRKTRINDKTKIIYNLEFTESSNKIRSII